MSLLYSTSACGSLGVLGRPRSAESYAKADAATSWREASDYCADLRQAASGRAQVNLYVGSTMAVLAVGAAVTSPAIVAYADDDLSSMQSAAVAVTPLAAAALFKLADAFFTRESAASELANAASLALAQKGDTAEELQDACTKALAAWDASRSDASKVIATLRDQEAQEKDDVAKQREELRELVQELRKLPGLPDAARSLLDRELPAAPPPAPADSTP